MVKIMGYPKYNRNNKYTSTCSIFNRRYSVYQVAIRVSFKSSTRNLIQTLLFSYLLAKPSKKKNIKLIEDNKHGFISAIVCMVLFSLSGIVLALMRGIILSLL